MELIKPAGAIGIPGVYTDLDPGAPTELNKQGKMALAFPKQEPATTACFAIRLGPSTFGIFDAFPDESGREAHLSGRVAAALMSKETAALLAKPPVIEKLEVLAANLPQ
jgi:hypothetical protein